MDKERCLRMWRLDQPQASHHPAEKCCHTAVVSRIPPTVIHRPAKETQLPDHVCGAAPHILLTFMDRINCTCFQENMIRDWRRMHEFMHGNRTDFLVGTTWNLPHKMGQTNVYPSVLPFGSNSILGSETFYSDSSLAILHFYDLDCLAGIFVTLLLFAIITTTARRTPPAELSWRWTIDYVTHLLDACFLYLAEHLQVGTVQFPGNGSLKILNLLQPVWLLGTFLLYSISSNELISLLIEPLKSTGYKSVGDVVSRNVTDLVVYYFPRSALDLWITSGRITLSHPLRIPYGSYLMTHQNQIFNIEMRSEQSIYVADLDELVKRQVESVMPFNFSTYISLDAAEDNFKYFMTSTTIDATAERHFQWVYMLGFVESGLLAQDVAWYRWKMLLHANIFNAESVGLSSLLSTTSRVQHFEPLQVTGFDEFFMLCAILQVVWCLLFAIFYPLRSYYGRIADERRLRRVGAGFPMARHLAASMHTVPGLHKRIATPSEAPFVVLYCQVVHSSSLLNN